MLIMLLNLLLSVSQYSHCIDAIVYFRCFASFIMPMLTCCAILSTFLEKPSHQGCTLLHCHIITV